MFFFPVDIHSSRRHAIFQFNAHGDIIRYIKTLLTRHCFLRVHGRGSAVACNSVCFWVTQHGRNVNGTHIFHSTLYVHKRYSNFKGEALISLENKAKIFEQRCILYSFKFISIFFVVRLLVKILNLAICNSHRRCIKEFIYVYFMKTFLSMQRDFVYFR